MPDLAKFRNAKDQMIVIIAFKTTCSLKADILHLNGRYGLIMQQLDVTGEGYVVNVMC